MRNIIKKRTILDLPLEEQLKHAKFDGLPHAEWVKKTKKRLEATAKFCAEYDWDAKPEGLTEEQLKRIRARTRFDPSAVGEVRDIDGNLLYSRDNDIKQEDEE